MGALVLSLTGVGSKVVPKVVLYPCAAEGTTVGAPVWVMAESHGTAAVELLVAGSVVEVRWGEAVVGQCRTSSQQYTRML